MYYIILTGEVVKDFVQWEFYNQPETKNFQYKIKRGTNASVFWRTVSSNVMTRGNPFSQKADSTTEPVTAPR